MKFKIINKGTAEYQEAYRFQLELVNQRQKGFIDDTIIFVEHPAVITRGRKGRKSGGNILIAEQELAAKGIKVCEVDRGGDVTLHCPGQLVVYPVFDLNNHGRDIHGYLRNLEEVVIRVLRDYSISPERIRGFTGVWVGGRKIASIGVGVSRWIAYHGVSLNVSPELKQYSMINVCGMEKVRMTSMEELLNRRIAVREVIPVVAKHFNAVFDRKDCWDGREDGSEGGKKNRFKFSSAG